MDTKRFEELKTRAIQTLYILDTLTGGGSTIHGRNRYHCHISYRLERLEEKGEEIVGSHSSRIYYTLDRLEQILNDANRFIARVKGGNK